MDQKDLQLVFDQALRTPKGQLILTFNKHAPAHMGFIFRQVILRKIAGRQMCLTQKTLDDLDFVMLIKNWGDVSPTIGMAIGNNIATNVLARDLAPYIASARVYQP